MRLFREEAIEAKRRRLWGEVRLAQPPSLTVWTIVLTVVCAAILAILILGRYTRKETVQGFLEGQGGIVEVRAVQNGRVSQVLTHENATVTKGTPLVEFTSDVAGLGQGPVLEIHLSETDRQITSLRDRQTAIRQGFDGQRRRLAEQIEAQQRLRVILSGQHRVQAEGLALAEADADRLTRLQERGFAPNAEVDRRRRSVLAERTAAADMDSRISNLDASVADLRSQLASLTASEASALAVLDIEGARLAQRRAEIDVARGHVIRAPVDGVVSRLQVQTGMMPSGNQSLLAITPTGSQLQARLLVPTRAVGFLNVGQEVRLQIEAFPFQRFGFVKGRISAIHPTVVRPGEATFPIEQVEPVYEVEVFITREYMNAYGQRRALRPGMVLQADIPIDRRRLWQQLFDPLLAAGKRSGV